jgi:hypothetical protein
MRIFVWDGVASLPDLRGENMLVRSCFAVLILAVLFTIDTTSAQVANPELEACRATGLIALREKPIARSVVVFV